MSELNEPTFYLEIETVVTAGNLNRSEEFARIREERISEFATLREQQSARTLINFNDLLQCNCEK